MKIQSSKFKKTRFKGFDGPVLDGHVTQSSLLKRHYIKWTLESIQKYLGNPLIVNNPRNHKYPIKCYKIELVEKVENQLLYPEINGFPEETKCIPWENPILANERVLEEKFQREPENKIYADLIDQLDLDGNQL